MPRIDCGGPHLLQRLLAGAVAPGPEVECALKAIPLHKLSHRRDLLVEDLEAYLARSDALAGTSSPMRTAV